MPRLIQHRVENSFASLEPGDWEVKQ